MKQREIEKRHNRFRAHRRDRGAEDIRAVEKKAAARVVRENVFIGDEIVDEFFWRAIHGVGRDLLQCVAVIAEIFRRGLQKIRLDFPLRVDLFQPFAGRDFQLRFVVSRDDPERLRALP